MFFGCLSAGRLGGIVAGVGFILPGFLLMLLASYLYSLAGLENKYFNASFRAVQPIVSAMVSSVSSPSKYHLLTMARSFGPHTKLQTTPWWIITPGRRTHIWLLPAFARHLTVLFASTCWSHFKLPLEFSVCSNALLKYSFISLGLYGVIYSFIARGKRIIALSLFILQYVVYAIYVVFRGVPSPVSLALGIAKTPFLPNLFALGLVAGSLSFGGAYTAIPFVQVEAVLKGGWLPAHIFLDGIAIGNILPAPLVIFATFVGYQGGGR